MRPQGEGALIIWNDLAPEADEQDVNEWLNREHHPERVGVPGFLRARRYLAIEGSPRYLTLYDTESPAVLASDAYVERLNNPTPWTRRSTPHFRNFSRTACRIAARFGQGEGGIVGCVCFGPLEGRAEALHRRLTEEAIPSVLEQPGICHARLLEADLAATGVPSEEKAMRGTDDQTVDRVLLVSANHPEQVTRACAPLLADDGLAAHGARPEVTFGTYRLIYDLIG